MNIVRNVPVSCPRCRNTVPGKESTKQLSDKIITECQWRCSRCGTYIKHGITKIEETK